MRLYFWMFTLSLLSAGCAGPGLKGEWQQRGYTEAEMSEIEPYTKQYIDILSHGSAFSNAFNSAEKVAAQGRVRAVFCGCTKKLGSKCQQSPANLKGEDRVLWAKSNGAEGALKAVSKAENPFATAAQVDPAECQ